MVQGVTAMGYCDSRWREKTIYRVAIKHETEAGIEINCALIVLDNIMKPSKAK